MDNPAFQDLLSIARGRLTEDLQTVEAMSQDEQMYLARVRELPDPKTDGLECNAHQDQGR